MAELTPMMRQYMQIKGQVPDCLLFFRLGDFYELFGDDAKKGAEVLEIALTHRNGTPMCGVRTTPSTSTSPDSPRVDTKWPSVNK